MKRCTKCGVVKPITDFNKDLKTLDSHNYECRECTKKYAKERYHTFKHNYEWHEEEKKRIREYYHKTEINRPTKEQVAVQSKKQRNKYPEKYAAASKIPYKLRKKGYHLHHWSYNKEHYEDIIKLIPKYHWMIHRFMIYDQKYMMYRIKKTGELLDTKEKHLQFINSIKNNQNVIKGKQIGYYNFS